MLTRLVVSNLAILENIDLAFQEGFTVLTGATGAGKSLVIDSLSLLLGQRASSELIRAGEEKATVRGYFKVDSPRLEALLFALNIPVENGEYVVERIIGRSKSVIKINDVPITLGDLNKIAKYLADIHSQLDFVKILNPENYLDIIDGFQFEKLSEMKAEYRRRVEDYRKAKKEYESLCTKKRQIEESRDFYEFQLKELTDARLSLGEEEEIENEVSLLSNFDKIYSLLQEADALVRSDFLDRLYDLSKLLGKVGAIQPQYQEQQQQLEDRYYELQDVFDHLKKDFKSLDYDPERLNELLQRSADLHALKKKYKKTIPELLEYKDELNKLIGEDSSIDELIENAKISMQNSFQIALEAGKDISLIRHTIAKKIKLEVERNLRDLLLQSRFEVVFANRGEEMTDDAFGPDGIDIVDFLIETNLGEGLKSLSKTVSGGEASRVMLAFKVLFAKANRIETIIFDEIDTGLSGEAAQAVAEKIYDLSLNRQVLSITHMPQVAAMSDHHILIEKKTSGGRTFTSARTLSLEEKIREVAHLISGVTITEKQLDYARELVLSRHR